jgi:tetratricopeptide (TPR) repeat protein
MQYKKLSTISFASRALSVATGIIFVLVCSVAVVNAQTGSSSGSGETRARRAPAASGTQNTSQTEAESTTMTDVASNPQPAEQVKTDPPIASKPPTDSTKPDRVGVLRAQILDAKTEVERVRLQRTLVDYLIALGRPDEAATELRSMLNSENLDAATYYNIGNGLARLGDKQQAVTAYRKAIDARQGSYPRALNNLGVVLLDLGRLDDAYDAFVVAIKQQNFRYAEASYNLGKLYAIRDEADLAISEWTRALSVQPDHVDAAIALARAYAVTGQPGRGLEVIDKTLKRTGANDRLQTVREEIASKSPGK